MLASLWLPWKVPLFHCAGLAHQVPLAPSRVAVALDALNQPPPWTNGSYPLSSEVESTKSLNSCEPGWYPRLCCQACATRAIRPAAIGVAKLVPPHVPHAEFALLLWFSGMSPVADHPTETMSGSILPTTLGPRLDHGAFWPHESLERLLNAPTEKMP